MLVDKAEQHPRSGTSTASGTHDTPSRAMSTRRNNKACQSCRARKVKCNGETPCNNCLTKPALCAYRQAIRVRRRKQLPSEKNSTFAASPWPPGRGDYPESNGGGDPDVSSQNEKFHDSVSATQPSARSGPVELYYGASSQFAFLQQIYKLAFAEKLFVQAKVEAAALDDDVNLGAVQLSLLLGLYQLARGRPNSAYLHLGTACRKAFAMGLHIETSKSGITSSSTGSPKQERRITIWCLYLHEW